MKIPPKNLSPTTDITPPKAEQAQEKAGKVAKGPTTAPESPSTKVQPVSAPKRDMAKNPDTASAMLSAKLNKQVK